MTVDARFMYWSTQKGGTDLAVPFPSEGVFETIRFVDQARNALGVVIGQQVGRSVDKQNMKWGLLTPAKWWEMNNFVEDHGLFFWAHYFSHNLGVWKDRWFYCGNPACTPLMINPATGLPLWYVDCSFNVIDTGEGT